MWAPICFTGSLLTVERSFLRHQWITSLGMTLWLQANTKAHIDQFNKRLEESLDDLLKAKVSLSPCILKTLMMMTTQAYIMGIT